MLERGKEEQEFTNIKTLNIKNHNHETGKVFP
jgi:hypothetical protein